MTESFENIAHSGLTATFLKLTHNQLESFPAFFFKGLSVIHLIAHYNNLSSIHEDAFDGFQDKLESLDLSQNSLTRVPTQSLRGLTSLVSLNLNYNILEVLPGNSFTGLISLLRLSIYGNRLKSIDPLAFNGIGGNLTRINLGANRLTVIPSESLKNLTSLQVCFCSFLI